MSTDSVLNARGHALLSLLMQHKLQLLSGTTQLSHCATSIGRYYPESATSVVDYAIASRAATPWVTDVTVGDAWPMLSDHCPLMLAWPSLAPRLPQSLHCLPCKLTGNQVHRHVGRHTSVLHHF